MTYQASEELAQILINHGFKETTESQYPAFYNYMKVNGYNPDNVKRSFSYGRKGHIIFDYINMINYKGFASFDKLRLEEIELKLLLEYFKLPTKTLTILKKESENLFNLIDKYNSICDKDEKYLRASEKKIKAMFERIKSQDLIT